MRDREREKKTFHNQILFNQILLTLHLLYSIYSIILNYNKKSNYITRHQINIQNINIVYYFFHYNVESDKRKNISQIASSSVNESQEN